MRFLTVLMIFLLVSAAAGAEQPYQPWPGVGGQDAADSRLQGFVDRLKALVDEAEKARAADPRFLRDLRDLARGFDRPWRTSVLADDFRDGDFSQNPTWTVTAGRYWVERGWGMRSAVAPGQAETGREDRRLSGKDAAVAIFGQILNQAINPQGDGGSAAATGGGAAAIHARAAVSNAFALEVDVSSWAAQGRLEFGLFQGASADLPKGAERAPGYYLAYGPGGAWELLRVGRRGVSIIDSRADAVGLEDKKTHRLEWTRGTDGQMKVVVDGQPVLKALDRGFISPFEGFTIINRGGDYIVARVRILGVQG